MFDQIMDIEIDDSFFGLLAVKEPGSRGVSLHEWRLR